MSRWWLCGFVVGFCWFVADASALEAPCRTLFKQKAFLKAASCFDSIVAKVDTKPDLRSVSGLLKDRFLRSSAISHYKAALQVTDVAKRAALVEEGVKRLERSFQQGYCEAGQRCRKNRLLVKKLNGFIGYSRLLVMTGDPQATIRVKGYRYEETAQGRFNKQVRPGMYRIEWKEKSGKVRKYERNVPPDKEISLNGVQPQILVKEKRILVAKKLSPLLLGGYVVGGTALLVGSGLLGFGLFRQGELNEGQLDPNSPKRLPVDEFDVEFNKASNFVVLGGVVAGAGGAILLGAAILHWTNHSTSSTSPKLEPKDVELGKSQMRWEFSF